MNQPTLLEPPEAPSKADGATERRKRILAESRARWRRYQRVFAIAIVASVAIHGALIVASQLFVRYLEPTAIVGVQPPPPARPEGMRVIEYRVTEAPQPIARREPEPEPEPSVEEPGPTTEAEPTATAAERLRPRVGDWRLWVNPPLARRAEPTPAERAEAVNERLHATITAYNDSVAAARARAADAMDWTVGEEGNKWGVSPGKIHLGPITLPFPFQINPDRATMEQQAEWEAIQRQSDQGVIDERFEERVEAIRERKANEAAQDTSSTP